MRIIIKQVISTSPWRRRCWNIKFLPSTVELCCGSQIFFRPFRLHQVVCFFFNLSGLVTKEHINRRLADYFIDLADPKHDAVWKGDARGLSELPYHLVLIFVSVFFQLK